MDQLTFAEAEYNAKSKDAQGAIPRANGSTDSLEAAGTQDSTALSPKMVKDGNLTH